MMQNKYAEQVQRPEDLIAEHMQLVRKLAFYFHSRVRGAVEVEDLIQIGYIGLIDASKKYERHEGVTFSSYASIRIRGAILDHLRRSSNLCRTTIAMQRKVNVVNASLERKLQRLPTAQETATDLNMTIQDLDQWSQAFQSNVHQSLDQVYDEYSIWYVSDTGNPEDELSKTELRNALRKSLEGLPQREALVLQLYYVEELNVYEIAAVLEVTTGRVSQIKKVAIMNLRNRMTEVTGNANIAEVAEMFSKGA
ncbi:MAG: FliA/WhiG family RNA polymerase sigma factor [Paracoccaceae bacterium]